MVPENVGGLLQILCDDTFNLDGAPRLDENVRLAKNLRLGHDDCELHEEGELRLARDLAFVHARVSLLHKLDLEGPVLARVQDLEAIVGDECVTVDGENVRVALADPTHRLVAQLLDAAREEGVRAELRGHVAWRPRVKVRARVEPRVSTHFPRGRAWRRRSRIYGDGD